MPEDPLKPTTRSALEWLAVVGPIVNVLMMAGALFAYFNSQANDSSALTQKFIDFQTSVNAQLATIQLQIGGLPGQNATVSQIQDHLHSLDVRLDNIEARLRNEEITATGIRADVDNIIRSDHVQLGPRR